MGAVGGGGTPFEPNHLESIPHTKVM